MSKAAAAKTKDLQAKAKSLGIKYFLVSFVDLFGTLRAKLVPTSAIKGMQKDGAGFAGFAAHLDMSPADPDLFGVPDPDSLIQLPWQKDVGWLASDLVMEGKSVGQGPRNLLKDQVAKATKKGLHMKSGVECEYFLLTPEGNALADPLDTQDKPCYDQSALMRQYDLISEICDCMSDLGWGPYQNDHEDANGQFEMNWDYDDALVTADRHVFFKFMAKTLAEKRGMRATFMPKPFNHLTGNGCHMHVSVWDKTGNKNLFADKKDEMGISKIGYQFMGGVMHSADALCAIFNPTVNSYKRINAPITASGATWSPNTVTFTGNNRTHMVRIPDAGRFEFRLMDGSTNPYLSQAGVLAAGLDGVENNRDPGERLDINMYEDGHTLHDVKKLPLNMLDALRLMETSDVVRAGLGSEFVDSYLKMKMQEWNNFMSHASTWERANTLDC
ncbi:type III glutamate--ammonia ligase [Magnetovibrio sp. PR-2]|uniref:type III glutamate--ammonia ligase n=1 Tax=Magnetovibrio sp. PR-2 TaxID=3120356 RepID=UPI002FCE5E3E